MVWSPYTKRNIEKLERVQRRGTKFILKTQDKYDTRLMKLNLMILENRRVLAVTFLFKALNGTSNININSIIDFYSPDHNSGDHLGEFESRSVKTREAVEGFHLLENSHKVCRDFQQAMEARITCFVSFMKLLFSLLTKRWLTKRVL